MIRLGDIRRATYGMSDSAVMELEATASGFGFAFRQEEPDRGVWRRRRAAIPTGTTPAYAPDPRD